MAVVPWRFDNPFCDQESKNKFIFNGRQITINQKLDDITLEKNTNYKIWDGSFLLSKIIEKKRYGVDVTNKKCVELGAGTGLVSMVARLCGADMVIATDLPDAITALSSNITANDNLDVSIIPYIWGSDLPVELLQPDIVLGSEIIYHPASIKALIRSLLAISDSHTRSFIIYKPRFLGENIFFQLVQIHFIMEIIDVGDFDEYRCPPYQLIMLRLKC